MVKAKLFVLGKERELQSVSTLYYRFMDRDGSPISTTLGGLVTVVFDSQEDDDIFLKWMFDESDEGEVRLEEGKIIFYKEDLIEEARFFEYKFEDAALVRWVETFSAVGTSSMHVCATISPAIQEYRGILEVKSWQKSLINPGQSIPKQLEESQKFRILSGHFENEDGETITEKYEGKVILVIKSQFGKGQIVDIDLSNREHDFLYRGEKLKEDLLKGVTITGDITRITLEIIPEETPKSHV